MILYAKFGGTQNVVVLFFKEVILYSKFGGTQNVVVLFFKEVILYAKFGRTQNVVVAELQLYLMQPFNCFKTYGE